MTATVRVGDLLRFPRVSTFGGQAVASGTVLRLPDGESTARVSGVQDERWRSWNSKQIAVWLTLQGPATLLDGRELFAAMPGCREIHVPYRGVRQAGFHQDAEFELVAAVPHADDCGAALGRVCNKPLTQHPCLVSTIAVVPHLVHA